MEKLIKNKIAILVDSSCSLTSELKSNKDVHVISLLLVDENLKEYSDDQSLTQQNVLSYLKQGRKFKTSASNIGNLYNTIEKLMQQYEKILFIPVSYGLSSQWSNGMLVKDEYQDSLFVVKNTTAISGTEYMLDYAIKAINQDPNLDLNKLVKELEAIPQRIATFFSCENLTNLLRSGRSSKAIVAIAKFLRLKPIVCLDVKNSLCGSGTNYKSICTKIVTSILPRFYKGVWNNDIIEKVYVCESGCSQEKINNIKKIVADNLKFDINKIQVRPVPNIVMVNTDFDSYGLQFISKINRTDCSIEEEMVIKE